MQTQHQRPAQTTRLPGVCVVYSYEEDAMRSARVATVVISLVIGSIRVMKGAKTQANTAVYVVRTNDRRNMCISINSSSSVL